MKRLIKMLQMMKKLWMHPLENLKDIWQRFYPMLGPLKFPKKLITLFYRSCLFKDAAYTYLLPSW